MPTKLANSATMLSLQNTFVIYDRSHKCQCNSENAIIICHAAVLPFRSKYISLHDVSFAVYTVYFICHIITEQLTTTLHMSHYCSNLYIFISTKYPWTVAM